MLSVLLACDDPRTSWFFQFRGASKIPLHPTLRMTGDGIQTHHARVPKVRRVPASARSIIQDYLNMVDWRHIQTECPRGGTEDWYISPSFIQWQEQQTTKVIPSSEVGELVKSLIYEPPNQSLTEGLKEIKGLLKEGTQYRGYGKLSRKDYGRRNNSNRDIHLRPQDFNWYGTN
jgi:hypothetical protein